MANKNTKRKRALPRDKRPEDSGQSFHGKPCFTDFKARLREKLPVRRSEPKAYN